MNNYDFCVQWVLDNASENSFRALDYGCGRGEIVKRLRARGVDAYGCDVFYEGGSYEQQVDDSLEELAVRKIDPQSGAIPFANDFFDLVVSNQVMEHVENLDAVLAEIHRVLKPSGIVLSLFPDKSVWREGHCGIPFLHWFPKGSRARIYYAAGLRSIGLGHFKGDKSPIMWSRDFCEWLDKWTHYRTSEVIEATFAKYFSELTNLEEYWLQRRLGSQKMLVAVVPRHVRRLLVRKLGGLVFAARKPPA